MKKSIVIGSDRDLRSWLFEAEEAPAGAAPAGGDKKEVGPDAVSAEEIQKLWALPYTAFVERLKVIAKDPKLHAFLAAGKKDGAPTDESIAVKPMTIAGAALKPTQSEIDLSNSVAFSFKNPNLIANFYAGGAWKGGDPIITAGGKYVIDGHHRWSQAMVFNPQIQLACIDIDIPNPEMALKMTQAAIAVTKQNVPSQLVKQGMNIYDMSLEDIITKFASGQLFMGTEVFEQVKGKLENTAKPTSIMFAKQLASKQGWAKDALQRLALGAGSSEPSTALTPGAGPPEAGKFGGMQSGAAEGDARGALLEVKVGTVSNDYVQGWSEAAATLATNCKALPPAGQFLRSFMPQTGTGDGGPGPEGLAKALQDGEINSKPKFDVVKEGRLVYGFERRSSLPGIRRRY